MQVQDEIDTIISFLRKQIGERNPVIGISGGIDSAVSLMILTKAFGKERILAYFMPDEKTPEKDYLDVEALSRVSGVAIETVKIDTVVNAFKTLLEVDTREALGNIKSRTRMTVLYYYANSNNGMVVGTTNRSEYLVGYYTKYGDGGCDIEPIMHLLKWQVKKLASALNVPESIINKKPSAGLWEAQTDETELGITYDELDEVLTNMFDAKSGSGGEIYHKVKEMYDSSMHKRSMPKSLLT